MRERRVISGDFANIQIREGTDEPCVISGYGAVFYREGHTGTEYRLWDDVVERVMPGAFDRAIREDDVRSLFNHDSNFMRHALSCIFIWYYLIQKGGNWPNQYSYKINHCLMK